MDDYSLGTSGFTLEAMDVDEEEYAKLRGFQRRYNRALLDKLALSRERERLSQENEELQSVLKQYLEGVSVSTSAVSKPNTLLMVNNRSSIAVPPVRQGAPTVVQEAATLVATYKMRA